MNFKHSIVLLCHMKCQKLHLLKKFNSYFLKIEQFYELQIFNICMMKLPR